MWSRPFLIFSRGDNEFLFFFRQHNTIVTTSSPLLLLLLLVWFGLVCLLSSLFWLVSTGWVYCPFCSMKRPAWPFCSTCSIAVSGNHLPSSFCMGLALALCSLVCLLRFFFFFSNRLTFIHLLKKSAEPAFLCESIVFFFSFLFLHTRIASPVD